MKPTWATAFARSASLPKAGARGARHTPSWPRQHPAAIVFIVGRQKSEPGPDFSDVVVAAAKTIADGLHRQKIEQLAALAEDGHLKEI